MHISSLGYIWSRSPTRPAACPTSFASSGSRSWYCGNWLSSADASSSSLLHPWVWSATEVRNIWIPVIACHLFLSRNVNQVLKKQNQPIKSLLFTKLSRCGDFTSQDKHITRTLPALLLSVSPTLVHHFSNFSPSVYCCCCLANVSIPGVGVAVPEFRPFFYVNVADISALENELSYVACK